MMKSHNEQTIVAPIDQQVPESAALLSQYVQIPSISGAEVEAGRFIADVCRSKGLHIQFFGQAPGQFNFAASLYPLHLRKPNILFLNHIDVVEPGNLSEWKYPPFSGAIAEGYVWGRGAHDNKGSTILNLMALSHFVEEASIRDFPCNITLLCMSDEERFGEGGALYVAEHHLDTLNPIAIVGEGAVGVNDIVPNKPDQLMFGVSNAHKRILWLKLTATAATNGHGSVTAPQSAVDIMVDAFYQINHWKRPILINKRSLDLVKVLGHYAGGFLGWLMRHPNLIRPFLPPILEKEDVIRAMFMDSINITRIKTPGTANNVTPQSIFAVLDCRLLPETNSDEFLSGLRRQIDNPAIQIKVLKETPNAMPTPPDHPLFTLLKGAIQQGYLGAGVFPMTVPITSDSNTFRAKGIPTFSTVPVHLTRDEIRAIHGPNERMPIDDLECGIRAYKHLIRSILYRKKIERYDQPVDQQSMGLVPQVALSEDSALHGTSA
jgi:carboxypeptidase PM20D1